MNNKLFLTLLSVFLSLTYSHAQLSKTIDVSTPGTLSVSLGDDKTKVTDLVITGTINDADFTTIKQMSVLKVLDMSGVEIVNGAIPASAFASRKMDEIILPEGLTKIGLYAFRGSNISSTLVLPSSVQIIESSAFENVSSLIDMSKAKASLTSLGGNVFSGTGNNILDFREFDLLKNFTTQVISGSHYGTFSKFTGHVILPKALEVLPSNIFKFYKGSVTLNEGLKTIKSDAFQSSNMSTALSLPSTLEVIESTAFENVSSLIDISKAKASLTSLGGNVFSGTGNNVLDFREFDLLKNFTTQVISGSHYGTFSKFTGHVILPKALEVLPSNIFKFYKGSVTLNEGLKTIKSDAFQSSNMSTALSLPSTLEVIESTAFENVSSLIDISKAKASLTSLGGNVFSGTGNNVLDFREFDLLKNFTTQVISGSHYGTFSKFTGHVILPRKLVSLPANTFRFYKGTVDLNEGLENILQGAFQSSNMAKDLHLPSTLKAIGSYVFSNMIASNLDFSGCQSLEEIGSYCFVGFKTPSETVDLSKCSSLTRFIRTNSGIGPGTFTDFSGHVILPENLLVLPPSTFLNFRGTVELSPVLENINSAAFQGAVLNDTLVLPSSLKIIGNGVFSNMSVSNLDFSKSQSLEEIGSTCFVGFKTPSQTIDLSKCSSLTRFIRTNSGIGPGTFTDFSGHVIVPENLLALPASTFLRFTGSVELSPVLKIIGAAAFQSSVINNILLPASVTQIDSKAFDNSTKLETLVSLNPTPPALGANVFTGVDKVACTLYVPTGSVELYQAAAQWKDFLIEEYKVSLIDNLVFLKSTEENLYQVKTGETFTVDVYANFMSEVRLGLFNASNGTFIEDIVSSKSNNRYTCQVSTNLLSGSYLIQPYILEKGEVKAISRKAGSHIIDRLLVTVKNNWAGSPFTGVTAELNNHLQISTGQEDLLEIATNKSFKVLVRYATSLATDIKIGLFDPTTGLLVSDVTKSVEGNIFTCKVPTTLADAKYNLIPYQVIDGNNVYVERLTDKSFLVDRLPLSVVLGEPEEAVAGCLTIEAIDSNSNNQLIGGKYSIKGDSIQEEYILTADGLKLENLPQGDYTITEVYPVGKYKPSSIKEQRVSIMLSNDCQTVTFKYSLIPNKVDLVFNLNSDTTHYTGVRVGEYYWMDRNIYKPVDGKQVTADDINNSHTWYRMFQYHGDPLYTDLVSVSDFNKYYGQYYSRGAYEYILYNAKMQESVNGVTSITATSWGDAWITGGLQLIGMCGNVSKDEVKQYLSYGYNSNGNNPPVVIQPKNYFDWFYHSYGNTVNFLDKNYETNGFDPNNTNKYGFNLLPNGSRFNGPGVMHLNHDGKDDQEDIPVVAGDFNGLNQKAAFNLSMSGLDIAEAPQMHYIKVNHWSTVRLTRRLTNEELGYKLYINRVNYQGVSPYGTVKNSDDYIVKCIWKTANLHPELDAKTIIRDYLKLDIIKLGLNEAAPEGYSELPNGLIRGLYVQHFIETPNGGRTVKSVDDIVYIAQFNPLLWAPIYNEQGVYQPHNDIGVDLVPSTRSLQVATPELDNSPVSIYPNPVTDILYLESGESISEVQVYSTNGKMVLKQANVGSSINVGHLASGTYVLKLQIGDKSYTHKMIKK